MLDLQNDGVLMLWKLKSSILTPVINVFNIASFYHHFLWMSYPQLLGPCSTTKGQKGKTLSCPLKD